MTTSSYSFRLCHTGISVTSSSAVPFSSDLPLNLSPDGLPGRFSSLLHAELTVGAVLCICHIRLVFMLVSLLASVSAIPMTALVYLPQDRFKPSSDNLSVITPSGTFRSIATWIQYMKFSSSQSCIGT